MQLKRQLTDTRTPYDLLEDAATCRKKGFPGIAAVLEGEADIRLKKIEYLQRLKEAELDALEEE